MIDLRTMLDVLMWNVYSTEEHSGGGIFLVLPSDIGKQFPPREGEDDSPPHITVLYVEDIKNQDEEKIIEAVRAVCKEVGPFRVHLSKVKQLTNDKDQKVYYSSIESEDLKNLNKKLKKEFDKQNLPYSKKFTSFKAHATIEYVDPGETRKHSKVAPEGEWLVDSVWLWGFDKPSLIPL